MVKAAYLWRNILRVSGVLLPLHKKHMQRIFLFSALMTAVLSCGVSEIGGDGDTIGAGGGVWGGMGDPQGGTPQEKTVCYMTAMDYQKGYDWRADESRETVKCSLVVYEDGTPVMKVPVGEAYEVSPDPDRHRIVGGHLYTDYSTAAETVVKCDGRQLFRYSGREYICGMEIIDSDLYSLGQSMDGSGIVLRKNGEIILSRERAELVGELVNDRDSLCFAFCEQVISSGKSSYRYYASVNGKVSQVAVREDIKTVWDILVGRDRIIYVASLVGVGTPVVVDGDSMIQLSLPAGMSLVSCKVFNVGTSIGVEGICRFRNGVHCEIVWLDGERLCVFIGKGNISAVKAYGEGVFFVMNPPDRDTAGSIYRSGELLEMPAGYTVMGNDCVIVKDGILHVGLSSLDGRKPVVWKDGIIDSLDINGYISAICPIDSDRITSPTRGFVTDPD